MKIERDTCLAVLAKNIADYKDMVDFVHTMERVMEERGHNELFCMINSFGEQLFLWDVDEEDKATREMCLNVRYGMLSTALMTYAIMVAAQEKDDLNNLYTEDEH